MISLLALVAAITCLLASGFYSGSEMGLYCLNRLRLRIEADRDRDPRSCRLLQLDRHRQETVLAILLGTNLANYLLTFATTIIMVEWVRVVEHRVELVTAAVLSPIIFVLGDVVPKNWYQAQPNRLMRGSSLVLSATVELFRRTGILRALRLVMRASARLAGQSDAETWAGGRAEVVGLLREGAAEGAMTGEQAGIVERVMNLSSLRVGSIMVPRHRVVSVPSDAGRHDLTRIVQHSNYSRLPVMAGDRARVVGIVNVYDVLADVAAPGVRTWMTHVVSIPASSSVSAALVQLKRGHTNMAIVTDPRRGYVGIITLKDVIEQIFGDLPAW